MMFILLFFFLMIRRPPRSTLDRSSAASDVYKRQLLDDVLGVRGVARHAQRRAVQLVQMGERLLLERRGLRVVEVRGCLLYTSPSPRDRTRSRMPSSA